MQRDYYRSIRKAILDYVLLDDDEKMRLGIMKVFDSPAEYGKNIFQGIEPNNEWKQRANEAR